MSAITQQLMSYGGGSTTDPFFSSVVLGSNMPGADGSVVLTDLTGKVWTPVNSAQIDTGVMSPVGTPTTLLNGTADYWQTPDSADFFLGTGNFTVEGWFYSTGLGAYRRVISQQAILELWLMRQSNTNKLELFASSGGATIISIASTTSIAASTWYYGSWTRLGNVHYLHFNGVMEASATNAASMPDVVRFLTLGVFDNGSTGEYWQGNLGPFRVTKGVARYSSSNYTPPTTPFPTS